VFTGLCHCNTPETDLDFLPLVDVGHDVHWHQDARFDLFFERHALLRTTWIVFCYKTWGFTFHAMFFKNILFHLFFSRLCRIHRRYIWTFFISEKNTPHICWVQSSRIRQFAQFVTSFYPREAFCSFNSSVAVSLLMSKQLVRVGIQTNERSLSENCCTSQFFYRIYTRGAELTRLPIERTRESLLKI